MLTHPATGLILGDPGVPLFAAERAPSPDQVRRAAEELIMSASGWRKVFGDKANEDSLTDWVSPADLVVAGLAAHSLVLYLAGRAQTANAGGGMAPILVGVDSRPTGPRLAEAVMRALHADRVAVEYLFVVAAPELMAYARASREGQAAFSGFCYISASHNPPGHNGFKFGLQDGGVLARSEAEALAGVFRAQLSQDGPIMAMIAILSSHPGPDLSSAYASCHHGKRRSYSAYLLFTREVVSQCRELGEQEVFFDALQAALEKRPLGVVAEMNGSARTLSIDRDFLSSSGLGVRLLNERPRDFAHRIVPEGESLEPCRLALEGLHSANSAFCLGYVPDCDGDRGNLVVFDEVQGICRALGAQEVFALAVLSELAAARLKNPQARLAVAVNDASSAMVEEIANAFGAECHRAEVGEANVVTLARELRQRGYLVPILGEGSNGGCIIHPSAVRDPLHTVMSVVRLLAVGGQGFKLWLERSGQASRYRPDYGVGEVLASLPRYATTPAFEPRAALRLHSGDQGSLKAGVEGIFRKEYPAMSEELGRRFGIAGWEARAYIGSREIFPLGAFSDAGAGGLKILLMGQTGDVRGFLWMRGSGTEPVLRVMAELRGAEAADEAFLLDWFSGIVRRADGALA